ncbi:MAG TPA: phosphotransferase [Tepidisphaeraceae bacterium]|jgi:hypothetical protein
MMLPRQLTWLHLLPADSSFEVTSSAAPGWLREPLAGRNASNEKKSIVAFDAQAHDLPPLSSARGFVGINCPKVSDQHLKSAGFTRIARYAVLPSWDNPRWFIPLGSPAVSSAGFNLYTPARTSARLKRFAARVAVYSRLPYWYRDQLLIAQREPSPLHSSMLRLFPNQDIHFALSAGAPEGARNRKASAAVIDERGKLLAFLKLAASDLATELLHREANNLKTLATTPGPADVVPRLLAAEEIDGTFVAAQAPLPGGPAPTALTPMHRWLLDQLTPGTPVSPAQTELVRNLPSRIAALPQPHPELTAALEEAMKSLAGQRIAVGAVHGDFAPWNLRLHKGRISAFDWEYGCLEGPAGLDEIHYRLQVGYLLDNWSVDRALKELSDAPVLDRYFSKPDPAARRALIALYLVDVLTRLYAEGYDHTNDMVEWNQRLLSRLDLASPTVRAGREAILA